MDRAHQMHPIDQYLAAIKANLAHGDSTEHTHRPALKALLEAVGGKGVTATNEPKRIKCGAPDFRVTIRKVPQGHIETKDIGVSLDEMVKGRDAHGDQFSRYRAGLPTWILTDYLDFRWYVNGELRLRAQVAELDGRRKLRLIPEGQRELEQLLRAFLAEQAPTVETAKDLAERMAGMTRIIRDLISQSLAQETKLGWLHGWLAAFREVLIPELDEAQFSDMFAQTIAYGLFAARVHAPSNRPFGREVAAFNLPKTNPFLRKLFSEIAGVDMPETIDWAVDDLVELLRRASMPAILEGFGKAKGKEDPVVHFYETFLAAYDPKLRDIRGVYYTPEPVVDYIVRSIDHLLRSHLGRRRGLADPGTLILDPAVGTATFLYFVVAHIHRTFARQRGAWDDYVARHLLNRIFGFEVLMAPYAVAHLKLGMLLQQTGYEFKSDQRLGIYLTNTLEEAAKKSDKLFASWVSDEANEAAAIKRERPILVVLGNPPYSGHSANRSRDERGELTFIGGLIEDYKKDYPELHKPAQAKWLHDDYVKFIRFAQWRVGQTGEGIIGFITNHGYLDNPTFRGMRRSLLREFSEIWVYDLHGSSKKKERSPSGRSDENVFDIQQGVAILLCVKMHNTEGLATVNHAELWGSRTAKYAALTSEDVAKTKWTALAPIAPGFMFVPQDAERRTEFERAWQITEVFSENGDPAPGVVTTHDEFAIAFTQDEMREKVETLLATESEEEARRHFRLCSTTQWDYVSAKRELGNGQWREQIIPILYRPFDLRFTVFNRYVAVHRRERAMRHMLAGENLGLATARANRSSAMNHFFCTEHITEAKCAESTIQSYLLPLYLFSEGEGVQQSLIGADEPRANISPTFIAALSKSLGLEWRSLGGGDLKRTMGPADVFNYAYAVFYSWTYRTRYAEFLKTEFPRLPLPGARPLFAQLVKMGRQLTALHLLRDDAVDDFITGFPAKGDNAVARVRYEAETRKVWINEDQYFDGVAKDVWDFEVGGYQVCEKWLKARKGRTLSSDDMAHYQKIVVALSATIRLMKDIDKVIEVHGGWPGAFQAGNLEREPALEAAEKPEKYGG